MLMEIVEKPELPYQIKQAADRGDLVVFIGAGMSRELGCSSWKELANNLIETCENEQNSNEPFINNFEATQLRNMLNESGNIKKIITICNSILSSKKELFLKEMKKSLKDDEVNKDNPKLKIYKDLYSLNCIFVTTNADRHIDQIFKEQNIIINQFSAQTNLVNKNLYKIHGSIDDPESLIFTVEQYFARYKDKNFIQFMQKLFSKTILFVGYGVGEFELLEYMYKNITNGKNNYFYLNGYFTFEKRLYEFEQMYFNDMNVNLIPYAKDQRGYKQLPIIIKDWVRQMQNTTNVLQNNFDDIDKVLKNPNSEQINNIIQKMKTNKNYETYFFRNAHKYKKLHLWLESLYKEKYFESQENMENYLSFLEKVSLQNKEEEITKTTKLLLEIVNSFFSFKKNNKIFYNDVADYSMVKILFNLPKNNITLEHIDMIHMLLKDSNSSILEIGIETFILPVLLDNGMNKYILKLLNVIFDYKIQDEGKSYQNRNPLLEEYNLNSFLKKYSSSMIKLIDTEGLDILISIIKKVIKEDKAAFNYISIVAIEEHPQNIFPNEYDNQIISFTRDLLEYLDAKKVKTYIEEFLKEEHSIFKRLAFHTINNKYDELKNVFWSWFDSKKSPKNITFKHEFYKLLEDNNSNFCDNEFDQIINWIKNLDYKEYHNNISTEQLEKLNAYKKKEWLYSIRSNKKAEELFDYYNNIDPSELEHPGLDIYISGFVTVDNQSPIDKDTLCNKEVDEIVKEIKSFDPSKVKKEKFTKDKDLIEGLANVLAECVKESPNKFSYDIKKFKDLDWVYKYNLIYGFRNAWKDRTEFNWEKVFDFILEILDENFFKSNEQYILWLKGEIANLIECGTKNDDNCFDKKYLPKAKKILFLLINNKEYEKIDDVHNLTEHVLNSNNGKALHALMNYTLRYARLNSSQKIKWEKDIKEFFTKELSCNTEYSKSIFNILGLYLQNLNFLDKNWLDRNFNKIFPLENDNLWEISISSYFLYSSTVYTDIYKQFEDKNHINKALKYNFKSNDTKIIVVRHICNMSDYSKNNQTILEIIKSKKKVAINEIIRFLWQRYKENIEEENRNKIFFLWKKIYEVYKEDASSDAKDIFLNLYKWFVFIDKINDDILSYLKLTVQYTDKKQYELSLIVENLERLAQDNPKDVGLLYKHMLTNNVYPEYKNERIQNTIEILFLKEERDNALLICNLYKQKGIYFLNEINKKYSPLGKDNEI